MENGTLNGEETEERNKRDTEVLCLHNHKNLIQAFRWWDWEERIEQKLVIIKGDWLA